MLTRTPHRGFPGALLLPIALLSTGCPRSSQDLDAVDAGEPSADDAGQIGGADAELSDAGLSDAGLSDAGLSDTGAADAGPPDLSPADEPLRRLTAEQYDNTVLDLLRIASFDELGVLPPSRSLERGPQGDPFLNEWDTFGRGSPAFSSEHAISCAHVAQLSMHRDPAEPRSKGRVVAQLFEIRERVPDLERGAERGWRQRRAAPYSAP